MTTESVRFQYSGARSMVLLHGQHLSTCVKIWRQAKQAGVILPETEDPDYKSLEKLLCHILGASGRHLTWICEKLELNDPGIHPTPGPEDIEGKAEQYLIHLIEKWQQPLANVPKELFYNRTWPSRWGPEYCIDAMLEHAVMHPIRHAFQLQNLIKKQLQITNE